MIDTHCHLTFPQLHDRLDTVLRAAAEAGVDRMITVGTSPTDAERAVAIAADHAHVFATVGLHPHYVDEVADLSAVTEAMQRLAPQPEVVALGEMGLDRHYDDPPIDHQQAALERQLAVAADIDLPIIIHNREATDDTLAALRRSGIPGERFVFHCFTGDADELDAVLDFGAMVSFTGIVTFRNARNLADAAKRVPLDRLMVETDSPYLTPEPHRKVRPNEPQYVVHVARFLAAQREMPEAEFVAQMDANAERFFRLPA